MSKVVGDRIKSTSLVAATGDVTATGVVVGHRRLSDLPGIAAGDVFDYLITDGADWELGEGTYATTANTFARTTVLQSSNSGNRVSFATGTTKVVALVQPASKAVLTDLVRTITAAWTFNAKPIMLGGIQIVGDVEILSTDAGAGVAPELKLLRRSASPAANDILAQLGFYGYNTATSPTDVLDAAIRAYFIDTATGTVDVGVRILAMVAGALATAVDISDGVILGGAAGGFPGLGKINVKGLEVEGVDIFSLVGEDYAQFQHTATNGGNGGSSLATTWTKRTMVEQKDEASFAGVAASVITLPAGKYRARLQGVFGGGGPVGAQMRLRDTTNSSTKLLTSPAGGVFANGDNALVAGYDEWTATGEYTYQVEYYVKVAKSTTGLGEPTQSGEKEVFAQLDLWKKRGS